MQPGAYKIALFRAYFDFLAASSPACFLSLALRLSWAIVPQPEMTGINCPDFASYAKIWPCFGAIPEWSICTSTAWVSPRKCAATLTRMGWRSDVCTEAAATLFRLPFHSPLSCSSPLSNCLTQSFGDGSINDFTGYLAGSYLGQGWLPSEIKKIKIRSKLCEQIRISKYRSWKLN